VLTARHPPLWARWLLTILTFAVLTFAAVVFIHDHSEGTSTPTKSEREAEVEANREGNVVIEEDQAPHTARLSAGVATLTALERAISGDAHGRIQSGNLTGPFQSGVAYPYLAVLNARTRQFTWCKLDPPPVGGAPEVPVSAHCRT
jgi:hypothetical protein